MAGISPAAAGTLLALVRIYNAVTDIVAGRIVDRTSTRWGRCRPFLLWGGLPLLLLSVTVFSVPTGWNTTGKLVYAGVTYGLLVTAYSFVNIPYGSLASSMTQAPRERARLSASRTLMAICTFSFLAMTLGMTLILMALSRGEVGMVAILSSTTPVMLLPLLWLYTRQRPALSAWCAAALVVAGTALVLSGKL